MPDAVSSIPPELAHIPGEARERARLAILNLERSGTKLTVAGVRKLARLDSLRAGPILKAYRAGKLPHPGESWGEEPSRPGKRGSSKSESQDEADDKAQRAALAEMIAAAATDEDRERCSHETARLVALGVLSPSEAREIRGPLAEARQSAEAQRKQPKDDPERIYLVSPDGALVLQAFERIAGEDRREEVLAFVSAKLEEDVRQLPSIDPVGSL